MRRLMEPQHALPELTVAAEYACIAADVADPGIIKDMESGKALALEVVDSNLLSLSLTTLLPLGQFATVHKAAPAQTLEQYIDE